MRFRSAFAVLSIVCALLPAQVVGAFPDAGTAFSYAVPIDAVSITIADGERQAVSAWDGSRWSAWQELALENEQDLRLRESNLVMLSPGTVRIRFRSPIAREDVHPIRVSSAPATFTVAALGHGTPRILSRKEWGADESLLIVRPSSSSSSSEAPAEKTDNGSGATPSVREQECTDAHRNHPSEFKASVPVTANANGEKLRWPQEYSPQVRLLVVHHTAIPVTGDERPGIERMRALYQYHAENRGWGDVGYHYLIDDAGQIYEGRSGGDSVVGGHVYCNNVGTIGVALMGNFDKEQPTQAQAKSLQWLLGLLAEKYNVPIDRDVVFHGKTLPSIVGHRQLVSTDCPGLAMWSALDQVRLHVRSGDVVAAVVFPDVGETTVAAEEMIDGEKRTIVTGKDGLAALSETVIQGRPGADVILPVFFRATRKAYAKNTRIARVTRPAKLQVWQERGGMFTPVRGDLRIPVPLVKKGQSLLLKVKVRLPMERGNVTLTIGSLRYTFEMTGRVARTPQLLSAGRTPVQLSENRAPLQTSRPAGITRASSSSSASFSSQTSRLPPIAATSPLIRIRLTPELPMRGLACEGSSVRVEPTGGLTRVDGFFRSTRSYHGKVECQIIDGDLALINELSLEDYLLGLAEEPDSEHFEKQRAFAIAARTYALYYVHPDHRKFPGMPYDGDDSAARFQIYHGADFEQRNPEWLRAVRDTAGKVLTYRSEVIRAPYFSTDTGKTRSPEEAGWKDFPFPEIFSPKDDPWCSGLRLSGHGVGMSGCGAGGQARQGKTAEQILSYYYPGTVIEER